jgi:polyhydroxyalkanoate synthesis repressor PhaR
MLRQIIDIPGGISEGGDTVNQDINAVVKAATKTKIIKRYQNRKLYDTQQSCYVTLDDIAKMIRNNEEVVVIDNKSKNDITAATLTQIIFESEKKDGQYAPLFVLREVIQNGNGSISAYLCKLGAFPADYAEKQAAQAREIAIELAMKSQRSSSDDLRQNLEDRISSAGAAGKTSATPTLNPGLKPESEITLDLPNSNKSLNK